ncbi:DNA/RNA non-specific endonuclease [Burkholderia multivorans]|uniref:DNA/RNA non-specific endonuclease n=1 Tax=Burkholderia multivorans TaxID=87883 RepID=UPI00207CDC6D|nr:DNA/RNA non-specific endonuclease [Burkholderia multivorans]MCO1352838.1 DNA/RNA non-specific endonuclease [Burkholderia multivorans]
MFSLSILQISNYSQDPKSPTFPGRFILTQPQQTARALAKVSCSTAADPSACQQKVQQRYAKLWEDNEAKAKSCASADACKAALTDLRQQQVEYSARENQLQQKLRDTGGLSAAETDELLNLKAADTNLMSLRTSALQSYTRYAGMDALKSLQGSQLIAELGIGAAPGIGAGAAGALTSVGAGALRTIKVVSGGKSNWNAELNNPKPNTVYNVDDSKVYQTDSLARVTRVDGDLSLLTKDRNGYQQVKAGREGDSGDDGGHLIATILNGPGEKLNIVPMDSNLNRGAWKQLENSWADALSAGKQVKVSIEPQYQGDSRRPEGFNITYVVGNGRPAQQYFRNSPGGR